MRQEHHIPTQSAVKAELVNLDDMLEERRAREEELPMSLAWFRRARLMGGGPPFYRIGNRVLYRRSELRQWVNQRRVAR